MSIDTFRVGDRVRFRKSAPQYFDGSDATACRKHIRAGNIGTVTKSQEKGPVWIRMDNLPGHANAQIWDVMPSEIELVERPETPSDAR